MPSVRELLLRVLRPTILEAIEESDRRKCGELGHDDRVLNWIGYGTTRVCRRCGRRAGLKSIGPDGARTFYAPADRYGHPPGEITVR